MLAYQATLLQMDAVRMAVLDLVSPALLFRHVLSVPLKISADEYALLVDQPVAMEAELGQLGRRHLACLVEELKHAASLNLHPDHLRTDGESVWVPTILGVPEEDHPKAVAGL